MKLKAVIVDDDPNVFTVIRNLCEYSQLVQITHTFTDPEEFLKAVPTIDFDVCLLDIQMDKMNGIQVARALKNKAVIFVTGAFNYLMDAIRTPYVGVVLKPIDKDLLEAALKKAQLIVQDDKRQNNMEYKLFPLCGGREKVKIRLEDIVYVMADEKNTRNKNIFLKGGESYLLSNCKFENLLEHAPHLFQANKCEIASIEAVQTISAKTIHIEIKGRHKEIELSRFYRSELLKRI